MTYNDSRNAAVSIYRSLKLGWIFNTSTFTGNFILAFILTYIFNGLEYSPEINFVFFLSILSIGLWISEAIPPFAVGIFIIAALLFGFGTDFILPLQQGSRDLYLGTWTSNVIWLLLGGFFLAEAMRLVALDYALFQLSIKWFGTKPYKLLFGLMLTTSLGSMIMSNTATTAMMIGAVFPLIHQLGKKSAFSKALLIGIPAAATLGGMGTIIGSSPNAIAIGALQEQGKHITFVEWMIFGVPTSLLCVYIFWQFLVRRYNLKKLAIGVYQPEINPASNVPSFQKGAVIFTLVVTVSMWLTEPLHQIPVAATSAIPIVLLTLLQVIQAEHVRTLPWDTLMLVAGGLALGIAIVNVGLADIVLATISKSSVPSVLLVPIFGLLSVVLSNFMSNTAAAAILIPLGVGFGGGFGVVIPLVTALSCSCALLLPVSTPSNAIAFATGYLDQKDFRKGGLEMFLIGPLIAILFVSLWSWLL